MKTLYRTLKRLVPFALCFVALLGCGGGSGNGDTGRSSDYTVTDLGTLGGSQSRAASINNAGQVVGFAQNGAGEWKPFLWESGQMTAIDAAFHPDYPLSINNSKQVVGTGLSTLPPTRTAWPVRSVMSPEGYPRAAMWQNGQCTDLGTLGGSLSIVHHINGSTQIIGKSLSAVSASHAFVWQNGIMQDMNSLLPPGSGWELQLACINDTTGNIIGEGLLNNTEQVFFYDAVTKTIIENIPGTMHGIHDINEAGEGAVTMNGIACVGKGDQVLDLNAMIPADTGWNLTEALAINDSGQIVGQGVMNGKTHAFLLTPTNKLAATRLPREKSLKDKWQAMRGWLQAFQTVRTE